MAERALLIEVHLVNGRYHGNDDWPPSPFRLFQALVAGAYGGRWIAEHGADKDAAFHWLERLDPPHLAAPRALSGAALALFVPNNDLDKYHGDPLRVGEIRVSKHIRPRLLAGDAPILYAWPFDSGEIHAAIIARLAERLHTLGLGIDPAFARATIITWNEAEALLAAHPGRVIRPSAVATAGPTCPIAGALDSLKVRYRDAARRFHRQGRIVLYSNARKPRFRQVAYGSPAARLLFDILGATTSCPLDRIVALTERIRDTAAERLATIFPDEAPKIHDVIIGRRDAREVDKSARIRITPLPSIGHPHADRSIRRILLDIPSECPLRKSDLQWAFSCPLLVSEDGEVRQELAPSTDRSMLAHYGIENSTPHRLWRTVTPVALPEQVARRRIDPAHQREQAKGGIERADEEDKAALAVIRALHHAGLSAHPGSIRIQREPFEPKGARAEAFAPGTRFAKECLWHVEITFIEPTHGPLVLGDGRYLGLGLMAPVKNTRHDVVAFSLPANVHLSIGDREDLLRAVRRALMALSRDAHGNLPLLFSGHLPGGAPAASGRHEHVFLACADLDHDGRIDQLMVAAPRTCDRSARRDLFRYDEFDRVTASLETVRAGRLGVIALQATSPAQALVGPARTWKSHTPYSPTRHAGRGRDPVPALLRDVLAECVRRGLPKPEIDLLDLSVGPREGVTARLGLRFAAAVPGPILLGRDSHRGGGLFIAGLPTG